MGQKAKPPSSVIIFAKYSKLFHWHILLKICNSLRLRSHNHEYEAGTVRVPAYEFRQTGFACISMVAVHIHMSTGYL